MKPSLNPPTLPAAAIRQRVAGLAILGAVGHDFCISMREAISRPLSHVLKVSTPTSIAGACSTPIWETHARVGRPALSSLKQRIVIQ
jgi:hypothetical protein